KKLHRKYSEEASQTALERVEELGYIDDEKFAADYAQHLYEVKHMAPYAISRELMLKGVDRDIVRQVVDDIEFDPQEEIRRIIEKKYAGKLNDEKYVRRAYNALVRLGYKHSDILSVLRLERNEY
ncbi:MAG: regulatory protein RecX, partial [Oscillospiraceae bacterium]|nr:regulatory protein RecX [Oscillospiraceae bacterium]